MIKNEKGPDTLSAEAELMLPYWQQMDAVLGGTAVMRKAGTKYMEPHTGEDKQRYKERLRGATLWNQLELTLNGWVGRPFCDGLKLSDDVDDRITALKDDIDRQGTNLDTFARKWFRAGLAKAFCHVLIEAPAPTPNEDGSPLSIQDAESQSLRPYWSLIEPDQVIAARTKVIGGKEQYIHVRIKESTQEPDPESPRFAEVTVHRIRVYERVEQDSGPPIVYVTMFRQNEKEEWLQESVTTLGVPFIPMVTFYADRQGPLLGKSPLQDLCDLNIKHWNSSSDQDAILRVIRFPILAGAGVEDLDGADPKGGNTKAAYMGAKDATTIGPYTFLVSEDPNAKFYYVEHTGKAVAAGETSLDKLEAKMAGYGSEFLKKSPDRQTATARTLDSQESVSPLQGYTLDFIDIMETALVMTAQWLGVPTKLDEEKGSLSAGKVILVTDFGPEDISQHDIKLLESMQKARVLSSKNLRREAVRRGILRDDFDEDQNAKELTDEALDMSATQLPAAGSNLDPVATEPSQPKE